MKDRARVLLIGTIGGAPVGLIGAWFYLQAPQSNHRSGRALPKPARLIRLGLSAVGVVHQIAALGRAVIM